MGVGRSFTVGAYFAPLFCLVGCHHRADSCLVLAQATSSRALTRAPQPTSGRVVADVTPASRTRGSQTSRSYLIADPFLVSDRDAKVETDRDFRFERLKVEEDTPPSVDDCRPGNPECDHPDWSLRMIDLDKALEALAERRRQSGRPSLDDLPPGSYVRTGIETPVRVGHPDTGYTFHPALGTFAYGPIPGSSARVRPTAGYGFRDCNCNTFDLQLPGISGIRNPGHGTQTSSQIVGIGKATDPAAVTVRGIAQGAELIPLRSSTGVIIGEARAFHIGLAVRDACSRAADNGHYEPTTSRWYDDCVRNAEGCRRGPPTPQLPNASFTLLPVDVLSISMGGTAGLIDRAFDFLERAMLTAERNGVIAVAAAGQGAESGVQKIVVKFVHGSGVVYPAAFESVFAVAASNVRGLPWKATFRGPEIAVMAPGEQVWNAKYSKDPSAKAIVAPGKGTSFSTAITAGVAALWLDYHGGRDALAAKYEHPALIPVAFKYAAVSYGHNTPRQLCALASDPSRDWPPAMRDAVCLAVPDAERELATRKFGAGILDARKVLTGGTEDGLPTLTDVCRFAVGGHDGRWRRGTLPPEIKDVCDPVLATTTTEALEPNGEAR